MLLLLFILYILKHTYIFAFGRAHCLITFDVLISDFDWYSNFSIRNSFSAYLHLHTNYVYIIYVVESCIYVYICTYVRVLTNRTAVCFMDLIGVLKWRILQNKWQNCRKNKTMAFKARQCVHPKSIHTMELITLILIYIQVYCVKYFNLLFIILFMLLYPTVALVWLRF